MKWVSDWPVIGIDNDGDGKGEPVSVYKKPNVGKTWPIETPADSDEFTDSELGKQWQWQANPKSTWSFLNPAKGSLRLYSDKFSDSARNLFEAPNVLLQKFPCEIFMVTTKLSFKPNTRVDNEKAGLTVMGFSYANLALKNTKEGINLVYTVCKDAVKGKTETEKIIKKINDGMIYLRVKVSAGGKCNFSYSTDGQSFTDIEDSFQAETSRWIGAKMGLFCTRTSQINDSGYVDIDWFRVEPVQ